MDILYCDILSICILSYILFVWLFLKIFYSYYLFYLFNLFFKIFYSYYLLSYILFYVFYFVFLMLLLNWSLCTRNGRGCHRCARISNIFINTIPNSHNPLYDLSLFPFYKSPELRYLFIYKRTAQLCRESKETTVILQAKDGVRLCGARTQMWSTIWWCAMYICGSCVV